MALGGHTPSGGLVTALAGGQILARSLIAVETSLTWRAPDDPPEDSVGACRQGTSGVQEWSAAVYPA